MVEADQTRGEAHGGCPGVDGAKPRQDDRSEGGGRLDRRPTHRRGAQEGAEGAAHAEVPARGTGAAVPRRGRVGAGVVWPRVSGAGRRRARGSAARGARRLRARGPHRPGAVRRRRRRGEARQPAARRAAPGEDRRRAWRGGRRVLRRGPGPVLRAVRACGRPGAGVRRQVVGGDPEPALRPSRPGCGPRRQRLGARLRQRSRTRTAA